jgi:hypothetical protein
MAVILSIWYRCLNNECRSVGLGTQVLLIIDMFPYGIIPGIVLTTV